MKVKNELIVKLVRVGCLNLSVTCFDKNENELDWNAVKFRRAIAKASKAIAETEKALIEELKLEVDDKGHVKGKDEDVEKFINRQEQFFKDESDLGDITPLPYAAWCKLKAENKFLGIPFVENSLETIIWNIPEQSATIRND